VPWTPDQFELVAETEGALVLDTRGAQTFKDGFVPRSINIGIKGDFAPWVGAMIPDVKQALLLVTDEGMEDEVVTRLARVGYDNVFGYLKGGVAAWKASGKDVDTVESISAEEFAKRFNADKLRVVDVRKDGEYEAEHVDGAWHASLQFINQNLAAFSKEETNYIHCAGGYRSMIAASLLKGSRLQHNVIDVAGGFNAIKNNTDVKVTDYVMPQHVEEIIGHHGTAARGGILASPQNGQQRHPGLPRSSQRPINVTTFHDQHSIQPKCSKPSNNPGPGTWPAPSSASPCPSCCSLATRPSASAVRCATSALPAFPAMLPSSSTTGRRRRGTSSSWVVSPWVRSSRPLS
jgi:rhodanese-related sulfurtransferase